MKNRNTATRGFGKTLTSALGRAIGGAEKPSSPRRLSLLEQAEVLLQEGDVLFEQRDWEGATDRYRAAVALRSGHQEAYPLLVDALYRRAHARPDVAVYKEETLAACEEALRLTPDCSTASHFMARTLQDLGRQDEAYRRHEESTLKSLTICLRLLSKAKGLGRRDVSEKLLLLDALLLHASRLCSAYGQESQGKPIDWEGYLSSPVDAAEPHSG